MIFNNFALLKAWENLLFLLNHKEYDVLWWRGGRGAAGLGGALP
jgi:hypothetical protein